MLFNIRSGLTTASESITYIFPLRDSASLNGSAVDVTPMTLDLDIPPLRLHDTYQVCNSVIRCTVYSLCLCISVGGEIGAFAIIGAVSDETWKKKYIVAVTTKRQISRFSLPKDGLFPLFCMVYSENGKIIWRSFVTATIWHFSH